MELTIHHKVAINLKLFKQCRFNHIIFDSKSSMIAGFNIYRLSYIFFIIIVQCLVIFGNLGFVIEVEDPPDFINRVLIMYGTVYTFTLLPKLFLFLGNTKKLRDIFDVARLDFLRSNWCRKHIKVLHKHREESIKISNLYWIFSVVIIIQWILFPLVAEHFISHDRENQRIQNIVNLPFPVSVSFYNRYFCMFYVFEMLMSIHLSYGLVMLDMYILSYGWIIITQYQVLTMAFQDIGNEDEHQSESNDFKDSFNEFKSTLHDLVRLDRKVKTYYSIVRPIIYIYIAVNAFLFIVLAFLLITRKSINFGMYSCNWTQMDIKFKNLLLLSMKMNDANKLILKFTPIKIINMQLFYSVMMTSYNIISIMVKTFNAKNRSAE